MKSDNLHLCKVLSPAGNRKISGINARGFPWAFFDRKFYLLVFIIPCLLAFAGQAAQIHFLILEDMNYGKNTFYF